MLSPPPALINPSLVSRKSGRDGSFRPFGSVVSPLFLEGYSATKGRAIGFRIGGRGANLHPAMTKKSIQERYAPENACFGCGPANERGLRIRSFPEGDELIADFVPEKHHEAFPGVLCGGIIGTLLDCHMNWTAAFHLMEQNCADSPPCTVTAEYSVVMKHPTPTDGPVRLRAWVRRSKVDRADVSAELRAGGRVTATGTGRFVAVKEGHPAWHRW